MHLLWILTFVSLLLFLIHHTLLRTWKRGWQKKHFRPISLRAKMIKNIENLWGKRKVETCIGSEQKKAAKHPTPGKVNAACFSYTGLSSVGFYSIPLKATYPKPNRNTSFFLKKQIQRDSRLQLANNNYIKRLYRCDSDAVFTCMIVLVYSALWKNSYMATGLHKTGKRSHETTTYKSLLWIKLRNYRNSVLAEDDRLYLAKTWP